VNPSIALRMVGADFLKIRKKYGTLIWALVLAILPVVVFFLVNALEHSSNPATHEPAGGIHNYTTGLRLLGGLFFGPLVAILIGVEAGTSDLGAGVFRDIVVTGRSRLALIILGTFVFAGNLPTPSFSLLLNGLGFLLLATGVLCAVAVGFASLVGSKPAAIIALIAWQLVAGALIASISSLGSARDGVLSQALTHFSPVALTDGGRHGPTILTMSGTTAALVILAWLVVFLGLGAWRTATMDA